MEVEKYAHSGWLFSWKKKLLRLSKEQDEIIIWSPHGMKAFKKAVVPIRELVGVTYGAYTCTFKNLSPVNLPPNWAAFSLIGRDRTYDFSAREPDVVECCVRTLQRLLYERRSSPILDSSHSSLSNHMPACHHGPSKGHKTHMACPQMGAFEPWRLGFFLWMRLRFRLQEAAQQRNIRLDHMLWTVFITCAFISTSDVTKAKFIDMAEKLQVEHAFPTQGLESRPQGLEVRDLSAKIKFQKEREMEILKDRYECDIGQFLPHAPAAVHQVDRRRHHSAPSPEPNGGRDSHSPFSSSSAA